MAVSCCSTVLVPRSCPRSRHGIVLSNPVRQRMMNQGLGTAYPTDKRLRSRNASFSFCIRCLRDTRAAVVTGKSWDKLILESNTPALVEFYASWCGPCQMVHRVIDEIAVEYSGKLKCFVIDAYKNMRVAEIYDVKSVPVVLLFKNGEVLESVTGTMPKEFYVAAIERVLTTKA